MKSIQTIFILVQFSPILRKRKKKHAKRKITQIAIKTGETSLASLCTSEKTKKSNSSGNPVYKNDRGGGVEGESKG